jgi:hypothetical protein
MHVLPLGELRQELGIRPIRVLRGGSLPPQAAVALATTTSASEPASKSERGLRSKRGKLQGGRDEPRGYLRRSRSAARQRL